MLHSYIVKAGALSVTLSATGGLDAICRAMSLGMAATAARRVA